MFRESKLRLSDFANQDQFELDAYLYCLFNKLHEHPINQKKYSRSSSEGSFHLEISLES